jgi:N-acetyl sugar amidotransferase
MNSQDVDYRICTKCIMDTSDPDISFDSLGVCNHCQSYDENLPKRVHRGADAEIMLHKLVNSIKKSGQKREYDCLIGVSGGVDSTYVAMLVKDLGLRPLAVHFDNGWNSELAVDNIKKTLDVLGIDLVTYVVDWEEFRSLQIAFLKASTPDGEIPTDHAITALLFMKASEHGIKYIISGMNYATEAISIPLWAYGHMDWKYIKAVNKMFGDRKLISYPHLNFYQLAWWSLVKRIHVVSILNFVDYRKEDAMAMLVNRLGWKYYGGKHYESIYTRFYQGYILPTKFNIDKRIAHLSNLVLSGQMKRFEAISELDKNEYIESGLFLEDKAYVSKKLGIGDVGLAEVIALDKKTFRSYPNSYGFVRILKIVVNQLRRFGFVSK